LGHRANFVLVDDRGWRLYLSRWAANGIIEYLAAGPAATIRFIEAHGPDDVRWWDEADAEGGAVVDRARRRLLLYGNDLLGELPFRRAALALLAENWPGWRVDWAWDGHGDLVDYVGVDRDLVRRPNASSWYTPPPPAAPGRHDEVALITVRRDGGTVSAHLVAADPWAHVAWHGPAVLDRLPPPLPGPQVSAKIPVQGLHVEIASGLVGWWTTTAVFGLRERTAAQWPGAVVEFWGDRVEEQTARCAGAVRLPDLDLGAAHERLTAYLERRHQSSLEALGHHDRDLYFMADLLALGGDDNWARVAAGLAAIRHRLES
jgi:hypothetical protein